MVPALLSVVSIFVVSSVAAHFAFCFTGCVVMLAFWLPSTAAHVAFYFTVVLREHRDPG